MRAAFACSSTRARSTRPAGSSPSGSCAACRCGSRSGPRTSRRARCAGAARHAARRCRRRWTACADAHAGAARRDSGRRCWQGARSSARSTRRARGDVGRVHGGDGRPARLRRRRAGAAMPTCEAQIKAETQATIRNLPLRAGARRDVRALRQAGDHRSAVRESRTRRGLKARPRRHGLASTFRPLQLPSKPGRGTAARIAASSRCDARSLFPRGDVTKGIGKPRRGAEARRRLHHAGVHARRGQRFEARVASPTSTSASRKSRRQRLRGLLDGLAQVVERRPCSPRRASAQVQRPANGQPRPGRRGFLVLLSPSSRTRSTSRCSVESGASAAARGDELHAARCGLAAASRRRPLPAPRSDPPPRRPAAEAAAASPVRDRRLSLIEQRAAPFVPATARAASSAVTRTSHLFAASPARWSSAGRGRWSLRKRREPRAAPSGGEAHRGVRGGRAPRQTGLDGAGSGIASSASSSDAWWRVRGCAAIASRICRDGARRRSPRGARSPRRASVG